MPDSPLFPDGRSIGTIGCSRCDVDFDLGSTDASAEVVMDRFFAEHRHDDLADVCPLTECTAYIGGPPCVVCPNFERQP